MLIDDIRQTINAAARSNVAIYAIDPRGLTNLSDISIGVAGWADAQGGAASPDAPDARGIGASGLQNELFLSQINLRALAEETNGYAAVNSNDFTGAFDRIVRDNSSYYVLAYYPAQNRRDGKFHRIQVRVSRPGVTVRARRGYIAPRVRSVSARATPGAGSSAAVTEALNSPIGVSDLAMRVFAAPFKGTAPNASVLFGVELSGRDLSLDDGAKIEIAYFAVDASGKTKAGKTETVTLNLRPESKVRITENGLRFMGRMDLPPGRYTLRVATRDVTGGKVGSVSYDVEVPDFAKSPLSMSGVALASMSGSALMTARPDELTKGVLPASPTALRTFPQNDELAMFAEVYDRPTPQPHAVDITAIVRSDEGTVVFKNEEERQSSELQGTTGGYVYQARVPLTDLQPGLYVLTLEARSRARRSPGGDQANPLPDNAGGSTECTQCCHPVHQVPRVHKVHRVPQCGCSIAGRTATSMVPGKSSCGRPRTGARCGKSMPPSGRCRPSTSRAKRWRRCFSGRGRPAGSGSRSWARGRRRARSSSSSAKRSRDLARSPRR